MATTGKGRQDIIEQVRKLLNLADKGRNSSEAEASAALEKAHAILAKHGLDLAEIHNRDGTEWGVVEWMDEQRSQYDTWNKYLAGAAAKFFNCDYLLYRRGLDKTRTYRMVSLAFIGEPTDVEMSREVWQWLIKTARNLARGYAGNGWSAAHRTFCEAFGCRVFDRAMQMQAADLAATQPRIDSSVSTALVVTSKQNAIQKWYEDQGINIKQTKVRRSGQYDHDAALAGDQAGKDVNLNFRRQVNGS